MFELSFKNVKKYYDANLVLENINFDIYSGEKVGIVGDNGSGKTTILKLIAGIEKLHCFPGYPQTSSPGYDEGIIAIPREATIAYLEQIPKYDDNLSISDILNLAFSEVNKIEKEMRIMEGKMQCVNEDKLKEIMYQYSNLTQLYDSKGGYDKEEKFSKICTGLKFDDKFLNKTFGLLSGGEKTRVILGKILIDTPDILLLDEPTNHLDMDSMEWLESYLNSYKGIVIIVSHDRYFLDKTVKKVIEIEDRECQTFKGNYSAYVSQKEEQMRIQYENYLEQQKKINNMEKAIKELRDWAERADNNKFFRRAASMQIKLDKMDRINKPNLKPENMRINIAKTERSGNDTIKAKKLSKSFGEKSLFHNAELLIKYKERVALIGPNGSGKTTLVKMLLGMEKPDQGTIELGANVIPAYLPQIVTFPNEELSVLDCFREDVYLPEGKSREYLAKYLFFGKSVFIKVKHLSGGEKKRLKLAKLLYENVNLLILDEPTNHLDIKSIETFESALEDFQGTIFFISHDRYFINKMSDRIITIIDNSIKSFVGNYDDYKNECDKNLVSIPRKMIATTNEPKKVIVKKADYEAIISRLENEIKELDVALEKECFDYEKVTELYSKRELLSKELDDILENWLNN